MPLHELQRTFQARMLEGRAGIEAELCGTDVEDFGARLEVYTAGYHSRLVEALATTYPTLEALLGDAEFERTMHSFIDAVPSRCYSVRYYGERVAEYAVRGRSGAAARVLADICRWEWTLADVFDAADDSAAGADGLAALPAEAWPRVSFIFRRSVRRAVTSSNAVAWWRSVQGEGVRPGEFETAARVDWLVWRRGINTMFRSLGDLEARVLEAAFDGAAFGRLCELIAGEVDEGHAPLQAAAMLRAWFADELIAEVTAPSASR